MRSQGWRSGGERPAFCRQLGGRPSAPCHRRAVTHRGRCVAEKSSGLGGTGALRGSLTGGCVWQPLPPWALGESLAVGIV